MVLLGWVLIEPPPEVHVASAATPHVLLGKRKCFNMDVSENSQMMAI